MGGLIVDKILSIPDPLIRDIRAIGTGMCTQSGLDKRNRHTTLLQLPTRPFLSQTTEVSSDIKNTSQATSLTRNM